MSLSKKNTPQKTSKLLSKQSNTIKQPSEFNDNNTKLQEQLLLLDPQQQGFTKLYSNEQQFSLRFQQNDDDKHEILLVRVSQQLDENTHKLRQVKLELMSDIDVFFHHMVVINEESFRAIKEEQQLNMPFFQIPNLIIKTLQGALDPKNKITNVLSIQKNGKTHLNLEQLIDFTQVVLLQLDLVPLNETEMKHQVMYKYNVLKMRERQLKSNTSVMFDQMKQTNAFLFEHTIRSVGLISDKS